MPKSSNNVAAHARRKRILQLAKGYFTTRSTVFTVAKNAVEKGLVYAYRDRKAKKRHFRNLWIARINAAVREHDMTYSVFMNGMKKAAIELDRNVLSDMAIADKAAFAALVTRIKSVVSAAA
jgi:large subunit ribosomal protein L20